MIEQLKKALEGGMVSTEKLQNEHMNSSYVQQGKHAAFKEVLEFIHILETDNGEVNSDQTEEVNKDEEGTADSDNS